MKSSTTIGIDARLSGPKHAGIGRYIHNLVHQLTLIPTDIHFNLFVSKKNQLGQLPKNFSQIYTPIHHYTLKEQLLLPQILNQNPCHLYHFPHFNIPITFKQPFVVTIHDLLWHQKIGFNATTLNPLLYLAKYAAYRYTIKQAITHANHIITPSQYVKNQIASIFSQKKSKISVTYEAASPIFFQKPNNPFHPSQHGLKLPFIVYTGSLYPHKNVDTLIQAMQHLSQLNLALVFSRQIFIQKHTQLAQKLGVAGQIKFIGYLPDSQIVSLYHQAKALIQPSESEGFGLTGLEAMAAGLPVIASQNSVLKEIYGQHAIYTDTKDDRALADTIDHLLKSLPNPKYSKTKLQSHSKTFSWKKMAQQTLEIYLHQLT